MLERYNIDPMNAAAAQTPASVSQQIYMASKQIYLTAFLLWHATSGIDEDQDLGSISLIHSISYYASHEQRPPCKWVMGRSRTAETLPRAPRPWQ